MTWDELQADVFRRLEENASSPTFWTAADVQAAIEDAYIEMSDEAEWFEQSLTLDLLNDRPYYDLRHLLPYTMLSVGRAYNDQTSRWLIPSSVADLRAGDLRWEQRTGEPERLVLCSLWWLGYWPRTQADSGTIKQSYTALPPAIDWTGVLNTEPGFPTPFHPGLVEYALADLWAQDGEVELALEAWQAYLPYEQGLRAWVTDRASVPMVRGYADAR